MILVVNEDPSLLEEAQKVLNHDRRVFIASNSHQAFELAQRLGFSVAVVDLNLRGRKGLELIRKLHQSIPDLSIIAICGDVQGPLLERMKDLGVVETLSRPVTPAWKLIVERVRARRFRAY